MSRMGRGEDLGCIADCLPIANRSRTSGSQHIQALPHCDVGARDLARIVSPMFSVQVTLDPRFTSDCIAFTVLCKFVIVMTNISFEF